MTLEAIKFKNGKLEILDQLKLPFENEYVEIKTIQDGWNAISEMKVRGAPAIAIVGVLTVAAELIKKSFQNIDEIISFTNESLDYLVTSRPTAVNIADAALKIKEFCRNLKNQVQDANSFKDKLTKKMIDMLEEDVSTNRSIGNFGALEIIKNLNNSKARVLTHCNTGSLATAGFGTALGVVRRLTELGQLDHCFFTETRPYNQGSRLTSYELLYEKIPSTMICDNMAGILMEKKNISAVIVGADRVVSNGDTANKIGTYQLAILANFHKVPFYVALPTTTFDFSKKSGAEIVIEERSSNEMTQFKNMKIAAEGTQCWNPSFDVTPGRLVTGFITEFGVFKHDELAEKIKEKMKF